jgi:ferritin
MESLLKPKVRELLVKAIEEELYAHNLYQSVANQLQAVGYFGAQKYFLNESTDELRHYNIHVNYFNDRGDCAPVPAIVAIKDKVSNLLEAFELTYETELALGKLYESLYDEIEDNEDCTTAQFLLQFLEIQRLSVGEAKDYLSMLKIAGDNSSALLMIDKKLGKA